MNRAALLKSVRKRLSGRPLVWFGTRGDDLGAVADLPNLSHSFSIISEFDARPDVYGLALEQISGIRVDLDTYDIDDDPFLEPIQEFRHHLLAATRRECAVFTYRPSMFLSAITFARSNSVEYLGMFKDHQAAFEHKPWVESAVAQNQIPCIEWDYISDEDKDVVARHLARSPVVVRRSRTSGGVGLSKVTHASELDESWPREREAFVSVARFVDDAVPVNVGAVVWDDGVTVHHPSIQLIGVPELTERSFGYCGNDFGGMRDIDGRVIDQIDTATGRIGEWMRSLGYRGAFGVDFLVSNGVALFTEVNPRFQGSTRLSSWMSREAGESCLMLEHIAALLHLPSPLRRPLRDQVSECTDMSQVVMHNGPTRTRGIDGVQIAASLARVDGYDHADVLIPPNLYAAPSSAVVRVTLRRRVTRTGHEVVDDLRRALINWQSESRTGQEALR